MKTKQERKDYKLYKKQRRKVHKELIKAAKNYRPWDEGFLFDFMDIIFKDWVEYYRLGVNVSAMEDNEWREDCKDEPTREGIAYILSTLLDDMRDFSGDDCDAKAKKFADFFAKYIHWMWD